MGVITDIAKMDRSQWRKLVQSAETASWFQSPEAYDFYASLPEMMTVFVVGVTRDEELKGVAIGFVTRDGNQIKQYFTRRAIINGGPMFSEDITDEEVKAMLKALRELLRTKAIYVETRNFVDLERWKACFEAVGFIHKPHYDMYIDCTNREAMLAQMHDSKRRQIRKAEKEGVTTVETTDPQDVHDYYVLLRRLYHKKVRRPLWSEAFFQRFVADQRGVLIAAKQGDEVIGGILCPILEGRVIYEYYLVGPAIVTWSAMDYANTHHIPVFDMMGAGSPAAPYSVREFKQQLGGTLQKRGRYLLVNHRGLYALGEFVVKKLMNNSSI